MSEPAMRLTRTDSLIPSVLRMLAILLAAIALFAQPDTAHACKFYWDDHPDKGYADLKNSGDNRSVIRYMYAYDTSTPERTTETFKVFHHVFAPDNDNRDKVITNGAGGQYPHHRGLYVGWMRTKFEDKTLDFWHCKNGAHQRHVKFLEMTGKPDYGKMVAEIHWNDAEGKPVIVETRSLTVRWTINDPKDIPEDNAGSYQIEWQSKLESKRGEIQLDGDRQHAGFQFRAASPVAEANSAMYLRPEGFPQQPQAFEVDDKIDEATKQPRHINLNWLAMTYPLHEKRYTIEYFEDPSLPKPSLYSERPYGRFGAFFKTTLTPEKPLEMRYRIRVTAGKAPSRAEIQKHYDEFVGDLKKGK
jgi:hypothetical protein